jgi:hypothetical protein
VTLLPVEGDQDMIEGIHVKAFNTNDILHSKISLFVYKKKLFEKLNNLNVFGSKRNNGPKQDSQNRLRLYMSKGGEPKFVIRYNTIK